MSKITLNYKLRLHILQSLLFSTQQGKWQPTSISAKISGFSLPYFTTVASYMAKNEGTVAKKSRIAPHKGFSWALTSLGVKVLENLRSQIPSKGMEKFFKTERVHYYSDRSTHVGTPAFEEQTELPTPNTQTLFAFIVNKDDYFIGSGIDAKEAFKEATDREPRFFQDLTISETEIEVYTLEKVSTMKLKATVTLV